MEKQNKSDLAVYYKKEDVSPLSLSFSLQFRVDFLLLGVWPLNSEKKRRERLRVKGSFSQFTQNEHIHTRTHTHPST